MKKKKNKNCTLHHHVETKLEAVLAFNEDTALELMKKYTWTFKWLNNVWFLKSKSYEIGIFWCQHLHNQINKNILKKFQNQYSII